jgi:hypothetical protein
MLTRTMDVCKRVVEGKPVAPGNDTHEDDTTSTSRTVDPTRASAKARRAVMLQPNIILLSSKLICTLVIKTTRRSTTAG